MLDQPWTDGQYLLLILIGLYFVEGLVWVRCGALLFQGTSFTEKCFARDGRWFTSETGGFEILVPLPATFSFVCQQWPVSLSPSGIYSYVAQGAPDGRCPQQEEVYWHWDEITSIEVRERDLFVNDILFVRVCSHHFAASLRDALLRIHNTTSAERTKVIDDVLHAALDPVEVRRRVSSFLNASRAMTISSAGMWLLLLVVLPVLMCSPFDGPMMALATWIAVLVFVFCWLAQIVGYVVARRRTLCLTPTVNLPNHLWLLCLSPPTALWARDRLARDLLSEFHPLAIAAALCSKDEFRRQAGRALRDLLHPVLPIGPNPDRRAQLAEQWLRDRLTAAVERFVVDAGYTLNDALAPPVPDDENVRSYCPRCESQFTVEHGVCHQCGGVDLVALTLPVDMPPTVV